MTMTNTPPPEIQNLIEAHVNGFNPHDNALFRSVFGDPVGWHEVCRHVRRIAGSAGILGKSPQCISGADGIS